MNRPALAGVLLVGFVSSGHWSKPPMRCLRSLSIPPEKKTIAEKMIQFDLESYQSFFDHAWSRTTLDAVKGSRLEAAVSNLCLLWKSAANTHHLPALTTRLLAAALEGYIRGVDPYSAKFF